ncbi:MAG: hypothetical protein IJ529_00380 [Alphaproteobacteria bacterium]|nr:hypothetical protein [Alphaproteobacteria bacterium]MBQ9235163.1 hypothetical protein [Alphaproteobacteria bacterium]
MKVYLYTYAYDKIKKEGYKSLSMFDKDSDYYKNALLIHKSSAKSDNHDDILSYLEKTFKGRLRSICVITDVAPVQEYRHPYLNWLIRHADVISFDLNQLIKDGIVEDIYCKDLRQTVLKDASFENIYKINNIEEIDLAPNDWHLCEDKRYKKFSPWATIKHYFLVLKNGFIPAEYVTLEIDNSAARKDKIS